MKQLNPISSSYLEETHALIPSDTIYSGELSASVEQTITVPTDAEFVIFTSTNDIYVNYDTTATVPSGTINQSGGELNPVIRYIGEVNVIHIISPYVTKVTLGFYKK